MMREIVLLTLKPNAMWRKEKLKGTQELRYFLQCEVQVYFRFIPHGYVYLIDLYIY
jgi:hypothetical protein